MSSRTQSASCTSRRASARLVTRWTWAPGRPSSSISRTSRASASSSSTSRMRQPRDWSVPDARSLRASRAGRSVVTTRARARPGRAARPPTSADEGCSYDRVSRHPSSRGRRAGLRVLFSCASQAEIMARTVGTCNTTISGRGAIPPTRVFLLVSAGSTPRDRSIPFRQEHPHARPPGAPRARQRRPHHHRGPARDAAAVRRRRWRWSARRWATRRSSSPPTCADDADVMLIDAFSRAAGGIDAAAKVLADGPPVRGGGVHRRRRHAADAAGAAHGRARLPAQVGPGPRRWSTWWCAWRRARSWSTRSSRPRRRILAARAVDLGDWPGAHLGLTRREAELLTLLGHGRNPADVARDLGVSAETVRTHTRNIYRKLGVNDRAAAVAVAWREGTRELSPHSRRDHHLLDEVGRRDRSRRADPRRRRVGGVVGDDPAPPALDRPGDADGVHGEPGRARRGCAGSSCGRRAERPRTTRWRGCATPGCRSPPPGRRPPPASRRSPRGRTRRSRPPPRTTSRRRPPRRRTRPRRRRPRR